MTTTKTGIDRKRQQRATAGAFVGTAIEWYDFFIFGTAAALAFGTVFYPSVAPGVALLASFATFWVGFLTRPLGGLIFGHLGDRMGRKNVLLITLFMMGIATTGIGFLPTFDQVGIAAPIMLIVLRAVQGLAVGGEWGGAVLLATENAPASKRGRAGAWVQQGSPAGSILATLVFLIVGKLPDAEFLAWGWRVPFLLSAVLIIVGLVIRLKVEESSDFEETRSAGTIVRVPLFELLKKTPGFLVFGILSCIIGISAAFFNNTFLVSWSTNELEMSRDVVLNALLIASIGQFIWQPIAAMIAERVGETKFMISSLIFNAVMIVPTFLAITSRSEILITLCLTLITIGVSGYYALLASFLTRAFPTNIRYSGIALSYGLCAMIVGGATPLLAQTILNAAGPWGVASFYAALVFATMAGVAALSKKIRDRDRQAADATSSMNA